jgi:DNA repair photolyase
MSHIYQPEGRAGEYSPYAFNYFTGCFHDCTYCWARGLGKMYDKNYVHTDVHLQKVTPESIRKDCAKHAGMPEQVLMSFTTDCYMNGFDTSLTTYTLEQMLEHRIPVAVLTKSPRNAVKDLPLMAQFGQSLIFGTTITTLKHYATEEPHADSPRQRISAMAKAKEHGIPTWISMEPAFSIEEGLEIIWQTASVIDRYRVGKMNYRKLDVDWTQYLIATVELLRKLGKPLYVKDDLAVFAPEGLLTSAERNPRLLDAKPFPSRRHAA